MKMARRAVSLFLALCLVTLVSGCAKQHSPPTRSAEEPDQNTAAPQSGFGDIFASLEMGDTTKHVCAYSMVYATAMMVWAAEVKGNVGPVRRETEQTMLKVGERLGFKHSPNPSLVTSANVAQAMERYEQSCLVRLEQLSTDKPQDAYFLGMSMGMVIVSLILYQADPTLANSDEHRIGLQKRISLAKKCAEKLQLPSDLQEELALIGDGALLADTREDYLKLKDDSLSVYKKFGMFFVSQGDSRRH